MEHNGLPLRDAECQNGSKNPAASLSSPKYFSAGSRSRGARSSLPLPAPHGHVKVRNKFREAWLLLPEFKDWLSPVPGDPYASSCMACNTLLKNYGKSELQKHGRGKRHLQNLSKSRVESSRVCSNPESEISRVTITNSGLETLAITRIQPSETQMTPYEFQGVLSGTSSYRYVQELAYFSGSYQEEHVTATQWFQKFERVATICGWDGPTCLRILPLRLKGHMEEAFTSIESEYGETLTYEGAKQFLMEQWSRSSLARPLT